jgi:HD-GYP domain-containing protein (c-di-GMP phosphodiesterase class II)/DNA-binding CsgD family transcriptional regulator
MPTIGLTGVLAALSLATDLGSGFKPEKGLRTCLTALAVGRQAGLDDGELADVFQGALLQSLGCTAYATENAAHFDDDLAFQVAVHQLDVDDPGTFESFGAWTGAGRAAELKVHFIEIAPTVGPQAASSACEAARALGTKLGLRPNAITALEDIHERWDGRGFPGTASGESLPLISRITHLAEQAVIAYGTGDPARALHAIERRADGHLDPELVALVLADPDAMLAALATPDPMSAAIAAEPPPKARVDRDALDQLAEAFGDLADLKCRFTLGHSRGVAALAERAAALAGLSDAERSRLRRAGLVHDVGRTSVSTGIWERPGPLSAGETDQVRLHAYWSERVLARSGELEDLSACAGSHHERLDGSGYHRGTGSAGLPREARLLAAADVMRALLEDRPHRPALALSQASKQLTGEAREGRLDPDAVAAVIEASGAPRPRAAWPADLTDREVEVLRLAARGLTNKQIADELIVSPRTVQHHLAHVYDKTGRRTRAGNALFAMEHGLLEPGDPPGR